VTIGSSSSFGGPVLALLKPIAKPVIGHELADLSKLGVERFTVNRKLVNHQVSDWMIARPTVWYLRLTTQSSATAATGRTDCNQSAMPPFAAAPD
jgi:hypothetical protein